MVERSTRGRILDTALDLFGTRGVDAVSLDEIARAVGVRKQTVLYWFASKDELVDEVLAVAATELIVVIDAALRAAPGSRKRSGRNASGSSHGGSRRCTSQGLMMTSVPAGTSCPPMTSGPYDRRESAHAGG